MSISPQDRHAMRSYKTVQIYDSQKLIPAYYVEITNVYYNFTKICAHICVFRYFFVPLQPQSRSAISRNGPYHSAKWTGS